MKTQWFNYLRFTRSERHGTLALFVLAAATLCMPAMLRLYAPDRGATDFSAFKAELEASEKAGPPAMTPQGLFYFDPNTATESDFVQLGLTQKQAVTILKYRNKGGAFRQPEDFGKIWGLPEETFHRLRPWIQIGMNEAAEKEPAATLKEPAPADLVAFDPNTVSEAELFRLGLPSASVKSILNYRVKGGKFRKPEDLKKMYALSAEDFDRIIPFAQFPLDESFVALPKMTKEVVAPVAMDINMAGEEQLKTLPGIGAVRAKQLVQYREKLGGFQSLEQVAEMRSLPDSVFQQIRPWLRVGIAGVRKINLNTATVAEL
ncbi:MAG: helix-hairpin-helix domain-containing protein, partial [Saprospiraceae bacterium]|nr:helix-hairpin-helix domain-containing protein [Saprospiraceae bacterium]